MSIFWRDCRDAFEHALRRQGQDPDSVKAVEAAWTAFVEFLQLGIDGIDQSPDSDADGFIVQWGRRSWDGRLPSLSFTRQIAVANLDDLLDPNWQPEYWQTDLTLCFVDDVALIGIDALARSNTGFSFDGTGPARQRELMPQHRDLHHVGARRRTTPEHAEHAPHDHQRHRADHHHHERQPASSTSMQLTLRVRERTPFT